MKLFPPTLLLIITSLFVFPTDAPSLPQSTFFLAFRRSILFPHGLRTKAPITQKNFGKVYKRIFPSGYEMPAKFTLPIVYSINNPQAAVRILSPFTTEGTNASPLHLAFFARLAPPVSHNIAKDLQGQRFTAMLFKDIIEKALESDGPQNGQFIVNSIPHLQATWKNATNRGFLQGGTEILKSPEDLFAILIRPPIGKIAEHLHEHLLRNSNYSHNQIRAMMGLFKKEIASLVAHLREDPLLAQKVLGSHHISSASMRSGIGTSDLTHGAISKVQVTMARQLHKKLDISQVGVVSEGYVIKLIELMQALGTRNGRSYRELCMIAKNAAQKRLTLSNNEEMRLLLDVAREYDEFQEILENAVKKAAREAAKANKP